MEDSSPQIGFPLEVSIDLTGTCGLNCVYCYAQPFSKLHIPYKKAIEILALVKERGAFVVKIAGGEPLLHPQFMEILDYIIQEEINVAILTSLAVPKNIASRVANAIDSVKFINFQVSLDSVRPEINDISRGKTKQVLSNIEYYLAKNIDLQIASVIAEHNIEYLLEIVDTFYPRAKRFHFMNVMPSVKVSNNDSMLELAPHTESKKQFWKKLLTKYGSKIVTNPPSIRSCNEDQSFCFQGCSAGHLFCVIDSNLDVLACNMAKTFILGNLSDKTFDEIWNSQEAAQIRSESTPLCHMYVTESTKTELAHNKALHLTTSPLRSEAAGEL